jgi:hypothetical protein
MVAKKPKMLSPAAKQDQTIGFEISPALIAFRRTAGDANRHLNTMLVSLETLKGNTPIRPKGLVVLRKSLKTAAPWFAKEFNKTDIVSALDRFARRAPPMLDDLSTLIAITQRSARLMDEHLLQLQNGEHYAVSLVRYLISASEDPRTFVDATWMYGGNRSAGRVHALFLDNGGNHDPDRLPNAPSITRSRLNGLFAFGRNRARHVLTSF